ncbi:hypothetical protein [Streptomyces sp. Je 1-369]|uniref:hypothetical protein n=1 Tax=Streptomyces sp. Je 1-369 TaxID=2966192 RepID=UPI0022867E6D|nr:hypothetical protein [Streptomyces sp. Je 1-369]WAL94673.1 hypothetical protein NOO62_09280 [Streptomyces sp. Je 1-369]
MAASEGVQMLTKEEIGRIETACGELALERVLVLSLAAAHRTLPVYQAYSEAHAELQGYGLVHDGLVGTWRVLRARPGASAVELAPRLEAAIRSAESDLESINRVDEVGLAQALAVESISTAILALRAYLEESRSGAFNAIFGALEVDSVWAEGEAERPGVEGNVSWDSLMTHYGQQVRDIALLSGADESDEKLLFRDVAMRAEREGMPFLVQMRDLVSTATS